MPTFRFALQGSALYGKKAGHGKHHGFGWTLFDFVGCSLVGNVELSEEGPLIAGTTSKIAPIAFGERAYYTSSNEDLCSFVASCGCQFGWQGSPDCKYAYPVFRTGHGRRACYAWLPDPRTVSQNVPRHHILDRCRILEKANQPWVQRPMGSTWTAQKGGL